MLELSHKNLIAWQKAIQLMPLIYEVYSKLPKEGNYNIISQMKRAGLSVSNNIAEGASRKTKPDKNTSLRSRSSVVEIDNRIAASLVLILERNRRNTTKQCNSKTLQTNLRIN